jgi:hypothetical protein
MVANILSAVDRPRRMSRILLGIGPELIREGQAVEVLAAVTGGDITRRMRASGTRA